MYYHYIIREQNNYNIVTKYLDELNNHLSKGSKEQCKRITSKGLTQMFCVTVTHHDVLKDFFAVLF